MGWGMGMELKFPARVTLGISVGITGIFTEEKNTSSKLWVLDICPELVEAAWNWGQHRGKQN